MNKLKNFYKSNSHNNVLKQLAGFGRAINRLYENRNHDCYSNGELTVLKKLSKFNPSVIIDGGANIGHYSLMVQQVIPMCKIYAFEPVEQTFEILKEKVSKFDQIIPIKKGLYSENGSKQINLFPSNTHSSLFDIQGINYHSTDVQTIELTTGDAFAEKNNIETIDLLKLDLEGAEYDALLGFETLLKEKKIRAVQFEYGYINITTKHLLMDFYSLLNAHGYKVGKIYPKVVEFREYVYKHEDFLGPNMLAVSSDETELISALKNM